MDIRKLGPLEVADHEQKLEIGGPKQRALGGHRRPPRPGCPTQTRPRRGSSPPDRRAGGSRRHGRSGPGLDQPRQAGGGGRRARRGGAGTGRLLGAFERFADEMPLPQFYWNEWTATMEEARAQVGGEALVGALAEGREMTLEEAVEEASSAAPRTPASAVAKAPSPSVVTPLSPAGPGLQVVLFTDIEGSTRLAELVGDTQSQELRRVHDAITRRALSEYGGVEIKHTGDGFMASFQSVVDALGCSVALQRAFAEHNRTHPATPIRIRAGLNAGEPVAEDADLFGTTVNLAARICDTASPDQILVFNVVRELAAGRDLAFTRVEDVELKEISGVTPLFAVVWDRPAPTEDADSLAVPRVGKG